MDRIAPRAAADESPHPSRVRSRLAFCGGYAVLLIVLGLFGLMPIRLAVLTLADFSDAGRLLGYAVRFAVAALLNGICFGVLGGLIASLPDQAYRFSARAGRMLLCALAALLIATFVLVCRDGWPNFVHGAAPGIGCLSGVWVVELWRGGGWARRSLALQAVALAFGIPILVWCCLDTQPLPLRAVEVSSASKRHLVERVRGHELQQRPEGPVRVLQLNQYEVELLANWGLQVADGREMRSLSTVQLTADGFTLHLSVWLREPLQRYLNVQAEGRIEVQRGELSLQLQRLRIGSVETPAALLPLAALTAKSYVQSEEELRAVLSRTALIRIADDQLSVELEKGAFRNQVLGDLEFVEPRVRLATLAQIQHLEQVFLAYQSQPTFEVCVQESFALAAQRTAARGSRAADENRAAMFALGVVLGHPRLGELLLGPEFDRASYRTAALRVGRVPLRGRRDLTRHFTVSSALSCLTNERLSNAAGVLKEELDAGPGGSGFSFADLLADRAGTRLALAATQDEASARLLQQRLAGFWTIEDIFPTFSDLPEGLSDTELEQLGGIGGARYQQIIKDMEQRLDRCQLLR